MADFASLGIKVTTSGATQAKSQLDDLAASGQKAQQTTDKLSSSLNAQKAAFDKLADEIDPIGAKLNKLADYQNQLDQALKNGVVGQESYANLSSILDKQSAAAMGASDSMAKLSLNSSLARREIGRIVSDAVTGNFQRLEMSSLTLANATGVMSLAFSAVGAVVLGAAAAIGLVAAGAITSQLELNKLNTTVVATGQSAGLTGGQLYEMASQLGASSGSLNNARTAIEKLAGTGMSGVGLGGLAQSALNVAQVTGQSIDQVVQSFQNIEAGPTQAIAKLNEQYNFLSSAQYAEIAALEEEGNKWGAATLALSDYTTAMNERFKQVNDNAGYLIQAAHMVRDAWNDVWMGFSNIGSTDLSVQEKQLQAKIDNLKNPTGLEGAMADSGQLTQLQQQLKTIQLQIIGQGFASTQQASNDLANRQAIQAQQQLSQFKTPKQALDDSVAQAAEQRAAALYGVTDPATIAKIQGEFNQEVAQAQETYKNALRKLNGPDDSSALLQEALQQYKNALNDDVTSYKNSEDNLTRQYKSGLLSAQDYYAQMTDLVQNGAAIQVSDINDEIAAINRQSATGRQAAENARQVSALQAQAAQIQADAQQKVNDLGTEYAGVVKQMTDASNALTLSLDRQVQTQNQQIQAQIAQATMGTQEAQQQQKQSQIESQRTQALYELSKQQDTTYRGDPQLYQQQVDKVNAYFDLMKNNQVTGYAQLLAAQASWTNGVTVGLENVVDSYSNVSKNMSQTVSTAFDDMTNALTTFVTTGKLNLKSFVTDFLTGIAKMEIQAEEAQAVKGLLSLFGLPSVGGISDGYWTSQAAAIGRSANGNVFTNSPDLSSLSGSILTKPTFFSAKNISGQAFANGANVAGEAGPEGILPLRRGSDGKLGVIASGMGSAVSVSIVTNVDASGSSQTTATSSDQSSAWSQLSQHVATMARQQIATALLPGGLISQAQKRPR